MNTFIKRSIKIALAIVFIGAAVVPACAQHKKGIIKGAKAVLGKKPPLTGTAPVVKPVTPRVPPTLQGAQVPTRFAVPNEALNAAVERKVGRRALLSTTISNVDMKIGKKAKQILKKIESIDLSDRHTLFYRWNYFHRTREGNSYINGTFLPNVPSARQVYPDVKYEDIPNFFIMNNSIASTQAIKDVTKNLPLEQSIILEAILTKVDNFVFVMHHGKVFIKKERLLNEYLDNYPHFVQQIVENVREVTLLDILAKKEVINFVNLRQQQIFDSIHQHRGVNSLEEVSTDITTQRTAEEIKSLVENLDPENSLRQAIEGTLKDNGYIAPAE